MPNSALGEDFWVTAFGSHSITHLLRWLWGINFWFSVSLRQVAFRGSDTAPKCGRQRSLRCRDEALDRRQEPGAGRLLGARSTGNRSGPQQRWAIQPAVAL